MATLIEVEEAFDRLSDTDKARFVAETHRIHADKGKITVWVVVLMIMAGCIFFFGYLGYLRLTAAEDGAVLFAFATTALGAIAGLLAPSPMAK